MTLPEPTGAFHWTQEGWGAALRCDPLLDVADHFFSTRQLDFRGSDEAKRCGWSLVASAAGLTPSGILRPKQVHGRDVIIARRGSSAPLEAPVGDIVATDDPAIAISVRVADCVPILIADPGTRAVAAAHSGWRGTAAGVATAAVRCLADSFDADPKGLVVAIGPSIGPCCYRVGREVVETFQKNGFREDLRARWVSAVADQQYILDLWQANRDQLMDAGVAAENIHTCGLCTATWVDTFYSYRREGPGTGRVVALIKSRR